MRPVHWLIYALAGLVGAAQALAQVDPAHVLLYHVASAVVSAILARLGVTSPSATEGKP